MGAGSRGLRRRDFTHPGNAKIRTPTALVSPGYAPYEQYDSSRGGESKQGPWTDIYGLGATLYRAVTGKGPIDATATDPLKPSEPTASVSPGAAPEQSVPAPAKREPVESPDATPAQGMTAAVTPDTAEETAAADEARKAELEKLKQQELQRTAEAEKLKKERLNI